MIPHHLADLIAAALAGLIAGVAVATVAGWLLHERIQEWMLRRRER